ncbi:MAG: fluoride efflux transporter CrcB [Endomicrobiia bacterium]
MLNISSILLGGSFGALARYLVSKQIYLFTNDIFPWGTLIVNLTGSLLIGFFYEIFNNVIVSVEIRNFITIGFLGAYTTFSTFSLENFNLLKESEYKLFTINFLLNNIFGLVCVLFGFYFARIFIKIIH